jgi:hypothetical protein
MINTPRDPRSDLHVIRRHESSRLETQSIAWAYEALIVVIAGRPGGAQDRPGLLRKATSRAEETQSAATGA